MRNLTLGAAFGYKLFLKGAETTVNFVKTLKNNEVQFCKLKIFGSKGSFFISRLMLFLI